MSLTNDDVKKQVVGLDKEGKTLRQISRMTGVARSTIGDFLRKETHTKWWDNYKEDNNVSTQLFTGKTTFESLPPQKVYEIETNEGPQPEECTHLMIPDTQCKPGIDMSYLEWVGKYIVNRKPDVIVHIGDHADMPSLSSYDKGKKRAEGRRVSHDIYAAIEGMNRLLKPIWDLQQQEREEFGEVRYKPRMVLTLGNHEERIMRHVNANPELFDFLSYDNLRYEDMGWEVYDFLKPVSINGVTYCHFMANPMTGKPYGGQVANVLRHVGESFSMGHKQVLDVNTRFLPASGKQQWGIIAGACYTHNEDYKGHQGNHHWRGLIVKHNVHEGSFNPMFVDLKYLERKYG